MSKFISVFDAIDLPLLGNLDIQKRAKGRLLKWSKYIYNDMSLSVLKNPVRRIMKIDKRTNRLQLPQENVQFSSAGVVIGGKLYPLYQSDTIHRDFVDVGVAKNCACEYQCNGTLCNTIKGYEAVQSTVTEILPNNSTQTFILVNRMALDRNGFVYQQKQYTERVYTAGVWTGVQVKTENIKLCSVDLDQNGCIIDNEKNTEAVCNSCGVNTGIPFGGDAQSFYGNPNVTEWSYYCNTKMDWAAVQCGCHGKFKHHKDMVFNISELGDCLEFPSNFPFHEILVRFYVDPKLKDMQIPLSSVLTFGMGLKWADAMFNDQNQKMALLYGGLYSKMKFGLFNELNITTIADQKEMLTPHINVPSFNKDFYHRDY